MAKFSQARQNMVDGQIKTTGVIIPGVLDAFETVKREIFLPQGAQNIAYSDSEQGVAPGRYLLEPSVHARMIEAVQPEEADVVLDIGGASGYSAALFSSMVSTVIALESDEALLAQAQAHWNDMNACNVVGVHGDLTSGNEKNAPYDIIFMNGAVSEIPNHLVALLAEGGRLIAVVKEAGEVMGRAVIVKKSTGGHSSDFDVFDARAQYLPGFEPKEEFRF